MTDLRSWRIEMRSGDPRGEGLPASILTTAPPFQREGMPDEVTLLLPTNLGPNWLVKRVVQDPELGADSILGLFLANPFLNVISESALLRQAGIEWIANLPSVDQQDQEFSRQLPDVALDKERELEYLALFRAQGFRIAVVVADAEAAEAATALEPEVMIVMPRVADFAAGFPSQRQRGTAAQLVADAARSAGWAGILLGLGEERELESEGLWPARLDGLVCRPAEIG